MAELVDAPDLGSGWVTSAGSSPVSGTIGEVSLPLSVDTLNLQMPDSFSLCQRFELLHEVTHHCSPHLLGLDSYHRTDLQCAAHCLG